MGSRRAAALQFALGRHGPSRERRKTRTGEMMTVERECVLKNKYGLHMRPAERLVSLANEFRSEIRVSSGGGEEVSAKSIISVISLGVGPGEKLTVRCKGRDEAKALEAIADLIDDHFGLGEEK